MKQIYKALKSFTVNGLITHVLARVSIRIVNINEQLE